MFSKEFNTLGSENEDFVSDEVERLMNARRETDDRTSDNALIIKPALENEAEIQGKHADGDD